MPAAPFSRRGPKPDIALNKRLILLLALMGAFLFIGSKAESAPLAATASVVPAVQSLNDSAGTVFTFTITNTGTSQGIGVVEIDAAFLQPSALPIFLLPFADLLEPMSCPAGPPGWSITAKHNSCTFTSNPGSSSDNIAPGASSSAFKVKAKSPSNPPNLTGTWRVQVAPDPVRGNSPPGGSRSGPGGNGNAPDFQNATASSPGALNLTLSTFEIIDAVVSASPAAINGACPPPNKDAVTGSTVNIVICGKNHAGVSLTPTAANSTLGGTFIGTPGSFTSGPISANSAASVVLANWPGTQITNSFGPGKTVIASIGASATQTSPLTTLTGYNALNQPPVAVANSASMLEDHDSPPIGLSATDADGDSTTFSISTAPAHGTLGVITPIPCSGTVPKTCTATVVYTPAANYNGTDSFQYVANDGHGDSAPATVSLTITAVNDAPSFTKGADVTVNEDSGAYSAPWATAISAGPTADETTTQALTFHVIANTNTGLFSVQPQVSSSGTLTFMTAADANGSATVTLNLMDDGGTADGGQDTSTPNQTFVINLTAVDDAPVAVNDTATVTEDDPATAVPVLTNDTDIDAGPKSIASVTQPANGTVVITGGGTGLTYAPAANYCNNPPGTSPDTFTYTLTPGSSTATVSITVTCVDDDPIAVNDTATVAEDSGATAVLVLANDTDVDAGPKSITSVTQPANGTVVITGGGAGLTYAPNADYCNTPPGTTPDTFTYTLTPGGSTATVTMTVTCVDDAPVAVNDAATINEDDTATAVPVLANDTDIDAGPKSIASVTQPAHGTVVITGGGVGLTYAPNADYCNDPPGTTPDTFTYTLAPGSSTATVSMTVECVDDAPVAIADEATVTEDDPATAVNVLANDTDIDGGPKSIASVTQPANGTVVITGGGTGLTYAPSANYCNNPPGTTHDTFTYTLTPGTSTATVSMTVTCVDDPSTAVDDAATVLEDSGANTIHVQTNDTDPDGGPANTITAKTDGAHGTVAIINAGADVSYTPAANYCNNPPGTSLDTFTYTVSGPSTATVTVTVTCVNDEPTFDLPASPDQTVIDSSGPTTVNGFATNILAGPPDEVGQVLTFHVSNDNTGIFETLGQPDIDETTGNLTFDIAPGGVADATVSVYLTDNGGTANSGDDTSATQTFVIHRINNRPPVATDDVTSVSANGTVDLDVLANDTDPDLPSDTLHVSAVTDLPGNGVPSVINAGASGGNNVHYDPNGQYTWLPQGGSTTDTFDYTVMDAAGATDTGTVTVTINGVNDPPVAVNDTGTTDEDTILTVSAPGVLANDTDPDTGDTKTVVKLNGTATLTQTLPSGAVVTINANGSYTYDPTAVAAFQALKVGQTASDSFTYTMQDALGLPSTATVSITINGVNDAPTGAAASHNVTGNVDIGVPDGASPATGTSGDLLQGASDPEGDAMHITLLSATSTNGGNVTVTGAANDGSYTYNPPAGYTGSDTFQFKVCDVSNACSANQTATLTIADMVWFINNGAASCTTAGCGRLTNPFSTLAAFQTLNDGTGNHPADNDNIFIYESGTAYTNGVTLRSGQKLIGQDATDSLATISGITLAVNSDLFPTMAPSNGTMVTLTSSGATNTISLGSGNTLRGFTAGTSGAAKIFGNVFGTLTVGKLGAGTADVTLSGAGAALNLTNGTFAATSGFVSVATTSTTSSMKGIQIINVAGIADFGSTTVAGATSQGIFVNQSAATIDFGDTSVTGSTAENIRLENNPSGTWTFGTLGLTNGGAQGLQHTDDGGAMTAGVTTVTNPASQGIVIQGTTHAVSFGNTTVNKGTTAGIGVLLGQTAQQNTAKITFASLAITTSNGTGLQSTNGSVGAIEVTNGTGAIIATSGPAIDITKTADPKTPLDLDFANVSSSGSPTTGINLGRVSGTLTATGGSLGTATGVTFVEDNSTIGVIYPGTISQTNTVRAVLINAKTGGTDAFSGAITALTSTATAIDLTGNTAGSIGFTGGLALTTTSGTGFNSSGGSTGNTVSATQNNGTIFNTITSTTGTALNVANTTIGASGLTFRSINAGTGAGGPTNGIVLNTTGASGGLTVSGTGSAGSGGTIQKTSTTGVSLTSVGGSVSLSSMNVTTGTHDGIRGTTVHNFSLLSSSVSSNGTVAADNGVHITDASGTVIFTNTSVTGSFGDNVDFDSTVSSAAVITSFTVTNGAYSSSVGGAGFLIQLKNSAVIQTGSFTGVTLNANATYAMDVVTNDNSTIGDGVGAPSTGTFTISGNTITNDGGVGVSFANGGGSGAANMYVRFVNNTMTFTKSHAINVVSGAGTTGGTMKVLIDGNHVGTSGTADSGSKLGEGIQVTQQGKNVGTVTITNNFIYALGNGTGEFGNRGIDVQTLGPTATGQSATPFDVKIAGNTVDAQYAGTFPQAAIYLGVDNQGSPTTMHAEIHGNTVPVGPGCEGNSCTASTGMIFYDRVLAPSTGTLYNFSGAGANVSSEIANTNTGTSGKTCAVDLVNLTLTATPVNTVS